MVYNEEVADFRKPDFITHTDYLKKHRDFIKSPVAKRTQAFLKFCRAVIKQNNMGALSIRESSYAICACSKQGLILNTEIDRVIEEAVRLRRHPANYKEDHQAGWANLVTQISSLRE